MTPPDGHILNSLKLVGFGDHEATHSSPSLLGVNNCKQVHSIKTVHVEDLPSVNLSLSSFIHTGSLMCLHVAAVC